MGFIMIKIHIGLKGSGTRVGTSVGDYPKADFNDDVKGNVLDYRKPLSFEVKTSDVVVPSGTTKVDVPIKFTKMFPDTDIEAIQMNVIYDAEKLSWTENGGYKTGSMIPAPAADVIVGETEGVGSILVSFVTDVNPITPAAVAEDNTFVTLTFTVKDASTAFTAPIVMTPAYAGGINHNDWIHQKDLAYTFKAGSVTAGYASEIKYGDVSGDGNVNIDDIMYYKNYFELNQLLTNSIAADLNLDSRINITDFMILKNHIEFNLPIVK